VKYWEIIADTLGKAGWSWGLIEAPIITVTDASKTQYASA
jgi:hypothetical protein